jgi:hypothetical protein
MPNPIYGPEMLLNPQPSKRFDEFYAEREKRTSGLVLNESDPQTIAMRKLGHQIVGSEVEL